MAAERAIETVEFVRFIDEAEVQHLGQLQIAASLEEQSQPETRRPSFDELIDAAEGRPGMETTVPYLRWISQNRKDKNFPGSLRNLL